MGRRLLSLLLFVAGYLVLATFEPLVAAGPALTSFVAATLLLAREPAAARILQSEAAARGGGAPPRLHELAAQHVVRGGRLEQLELEAIADQLALHRHHVV